MSDLLDDGALLDLRPRAKPTDPAGVLAEERQRRSDVRNTLSDDLARLSGGGQQDAARGAVASPGTCTLCGQRPARGTCAACGRMACAADLWVMLRLCRGCASEGDLERGQRGARPETRNWLEDGA